jgi:N-acetylglucosamine kinase-like BadF-type ATPase
MFVGRRSARIPASSFCCFSLTTVARPVSTTHFIVGLDAGGSKTLLRGEHVGHPEPIERRGPGANPNRVGMEEAAGILVDLIDESLQGRSVPDRISVCAGVSGAGRAEEQEALGEAIRGTLSGPGCTVHVEVVHDALIALDAAYDAESGLIVIAGTGSVALARTVEGRLLRVGGWGHLLGDPGSGYSVGQKGLRAVAAACDGGDATTLRARLREQFGIEDREQLIHAVYQDGISMQDVAPLVVDAAADDAVAAGILADEADGLAEQVGWLVDQSDPITPRITLLGGMIQNDRYDRVLRGRLRDHFPDWSVRQLQTEPVTGALRRARRLLKQDVGCGP